MSKARSPRYPAIGLKEALDKVGLVYAEDYQNKVPRHVIVEHMGYQSLNGKSLGVLSAVAKYGLLEGRASENWVSDLALAIIAHEPGSPERVAAIKEAASKPDLFSELDARFPGKVSDSAIRAYLLTQKFIPAAADTAIRSYRETKKLVETESSGYALADQDDAEEELFVPEQQIRNSASAGQRQQHETIVRRSAGGEPFRVTFGSGGIEVSGRLTTPHDAEEFVQAINALKLLLRPTEEVKRPADENSTFSPGDVAPADGIYSATHIGHFPHDTKVTLAKGDRFPLCEKCIGGPVRFTAR